MNIKILKFIVIFLGILIFLGLIVLTIGIYHKFNNLKKNNTNTIYFKQPEKYKLKDFYIDNQQIVIKYITENKSIIHVYDLLTGKEIKKIELLK